MFSSVFGDVNKRENSTHVHTGMFHVKIFLRFAAKFRSQLRQRRMDSEFAISSALYARIQVSLKKQCTLINSRETSTDDLKNFKKPKGTEVLRNWSNRIVESIYILWTRNKKSHIHMYAWDTYVHTWTHRSAVWHSLLYFGTRAPGMSGLSSY